MKGKTKLYAILLTIICIVLLSILFFLGFKFSNNNSFCIYSSIFIIFIFVIIHCITSKKYDEEINKIKSSTTNIEFKCIDIFYCLISRVDSSDYINAYLILEDVINNKKYGISYKMTKFHSYSYFATKIKFNCKVNDIGNLWIKNIIESPYSSENNTIRFKYGKINEYYQYYKNKHLSYFQPTWTNLNKNNDVTILNDVTFVDGYYELK